MLPGFGSLALITLLLGNAPPNGSPGSYVTTYTRTPAGIREISTKAYVPQPGDIVLYDDHKLHWKILYNVAGTEPPDHSGIVILNKDGTPAILESGPNNGRYVEILDWHPRLTNFAGTTYIRRLKTPLTREQSAQLTEFAYAQEGKRYATGRLMLQMTPFRCRGSLRKKFFGCTNLSRNRWLCSELVVAAGTVVGLFDPKQHPANAIYPRDIIFDHYYDLSDTWHLAGVWSPAPPKIRQEGQK